MTTFGEFFNQLRCRIEKTGRTDAQCHDMDNYRSLLQWRTGVDPLGVVRPAWDDVIKQELSDSNLLEFSREVTQEGMRRLSNEVDSDEFNPEFFGWHLDSAHEFHHAILEEAQKCGLDVPTPFELVGS